MNYFSDVRFYKWVVLILIVLNIATISFLWMGHMKSSCEQNPHRKDVALEREHRNENFLKKELELNDEQIANFKSYRKEHFKRTSEKREAMMLAKDALFQEVFKAEDDSATVDSLLNNISEIKREISSMDFKHFVDLRDQCNPEQQKKLKRLLNKMFKRMDEDGYHGRNKKKENMRKQGKSDSQNGRPCCESNNLY